MCSHYWASLTRTDRSKREVSSICRHDACKDGLKHDPVKLGVRHEVVRGKQTLVDQRLYALTGRTAVTELDGVAVIRLDGAKGIEA